MRWDDTTKSVEANMPINLNSVRGLRQRFGDCAYCRNLDESEERFLHTCAHFFSELVSTDLWKSRQTWQSTQARLCGNPAGQ
jgi:hypothetical protein